MGEEGLWLREQKLGREHPLWRDHREETRLYLLLIAALTNKVITFEQERHQPEDGNCPHLTRLGNGDGLVVKLFHRKGLHLGTTKSSRPNI